MDISSMILAATSWRTGTSILFIIVVGIIVGGVAYYLSTGAARTAAEERKPS